MITSLPPLKCFIALYMLYRELGWAGFGAIIIILVLIPVGSCVAKFVAKLEVEFLKHRDVRYTHMLFLTYLNVAYYFF